jgi:hypothetical protein
MSKKVPPLAHRLVNELQLVVGAMQLGDYEGSLKAISRARALCDELHSEIRTVIERKQNDLRAKKAR